MLPKALAAGCPYETFMSLTPKESQCFYEAYRIRREQIDDMSWVMGMYVLRAVSTALDHGFNGRKARSEYFDKPLMTDFIQQTQQTAAVEDHKHGHDPDELSDEQIEAKRRELATMLDVMMYNFNGQKMLEQENEVTEDGIVNQSTDNSGSDSGSSS